MQIELITIGSEVLDGFTLNTNAAFIGQELLKAGYRLSRQIVLSDDPVILKEAIQLSKERSDLVITTGGLGPTCDDLTRQTVAELFHSDFSFHQEVSEKLIQRLGKDFPTLKDQATLPTKAMPLHNLLGTAPGLIFDEDGVVILLPGVPHEMQALFMEQVIPYLHKRFGTGECWAVKRLHLMQLFEAEVDPLLREMQDKYPQVTFGIYPSLGLLDVQLMAREEKDLTAPLEELESKFGRYVFDSPSGTIEEAVHLKMIEKGRTLALAESCTGGAIAARLTALPGSSAYFLGGMVTYANEMKTNLLGVSKKIIQEYGAVSREVVIAMWQGALQKSGSDYAIAVSGIAGPDGGTAEKPVGTVWCAVGRKGQEPHVWKLRRGGSREVIIRRATNLLLSELYLRITNE